MAPTLPINGRAWCKELLPEQTNQQIKICRLHCCFHEPNCRSASGSRKHFFISYTNSQLLHCYNCTLQLMFYCVCFIYPHLSLFTKCLRRRNCKLQRHHPRGRQFSGLRHIWEIIIKFHCYLLYIFICNSLSQSFAVLSCPGASI